MEPGQTINGRYRIQREIGRGCFGVVYLADDLQEGQPRAVKILLPDAKSDEALRRRLRREAKYASQLTSPHAVRIFECEESEDDNVFLVMEYLEGRELSHALKENGKLPPDRVARIAEQILHALQDAHAVGLIHRDLKPSNVFLSEESGEADFVKVLDFGIAKVGREGQLMESMQLTEFGRILGTPLYMSPEQCRGGDLTPASDLYSLGILLYELLTGQPPFDDSNPARVLMMHNTEPVPALPAALANTDLGRAILRSLEKVPEARYASAEQFRAAIRGETPAAPVQETSHETERPAPAEKKKSFVAALFRLFRRGK